VEYDKQGLKSPLYNVYIFNPYCKENTTHNHNKNKSVI
jgi:hypothetical protein